MKNPPLYQSTDGRSGGSLTPSSRYKHRIEVMLSVSKEGRRLSAKEIAERHNIGYSTISLDPEGLSKTEWVLCYSGLPADPQRAGKKP